MRCIKTRKTTNRDNKYDAPLQLSEKAGETITRPYSRVRMG